ncbi:MAG: hypothetical protein GYA26_11870 [Flexilinea flocculi]|jgi:hypothetical protein|nr:hypothetical protein [Flexilinea flocculi]
MKFIERIIPHISIILSGMLLVFFVIDRFNQKMGFMEDDTTKIMILALSISSIMTSILFIRLRNKY